MVRTEQAWRRAKNSDLEDAEHDYLRKRRRRRLQTNAIIGIVGLAMIGGVWIRDALFFGIYWFVVILLVLWIILLAAVDFFHTRLYFRQMQLRYSAERTALKAELRKFQTPESNGKAKGPSHDDSFEEL